MNTREYLLALAEQVEAYDPKLSPDNRADELLLHQDVVMLTGEDSLTCDFDRTFVRSVDAAMMLVPNGMKVNLERDPEGRGRARLYGYDESGWAARPNFNGLASTPALALTAASLRTRAALAKARGETAVPHIPRGE